MLARAAPATPAGAAGFRDGGGAGQNYFCHTLNLLALFEAHASVKREHRDRTAETADTRSALRAGVAGAYLRNVRSLVRGSDAADDPLHVHGVRLPQSVSIAELQRSFRLSESRFAASMAVRVEHLAELVVLHHESLRIQRLQRRPGQDFEYRWLRRRLVQLQSILVDFFHQKSNVQNLLSQSLVKKRVNDAALRATVNPSFKVRRLFGRMIDQICNLTTFFVEIGDQAEIMGEKSQSLRSGPLFQSELMQNEGHFGNAGPEDSTAHRVIQLRSAEEAPETGDTDAVPVSEGNHTAVSQQNPVAQSAGVRTKIRAAQWFIAQILVNHLLFFVKVVLLVVTTGLVIQLAFEHEADLRFDTDKIFEGFGEFVLGFWMLGALVYVLDSKDIPHAHLFGVGVAQRWRPGPILDAALAVSIFFMTTVLLYQYSITFAWKGGFDPLSQMQNGTSEAVLEAKDTLQSLRDGLAYICPLVFLWTSGIGVMTFSLGCPCCRSRRFLWQTLPRVYVSPFVVPTFADSWVGDVLTSYTKAFSHVAALVTSSVVWDATVDWDTCAEGFALFDVGNETQGVNISVPSFHSTTTTTTLPVPGAVARDYMLAARSVDVAKLVTAVLLGLPLWWRFMQNMRVYIHTHQAWPALANAFKYAMALSLVFITSFHVRSGEPAGAMSGGLFAVYVVFYVLSTLYAFLWDIFMDWGLLRFQFYGCWCWQTRRRKRTTDRTSNCDANGFSCNVRLRHSGRRRFSLAVYSVAAVVDLALRFVWAMNLTPTTSPFAAFFSSYLGPFVGSVEVLRRAMWSIFRLEHRYLVQLRKCQESLGTVVIQQDTNRRETRFSDAFAASERTQRAPHADEKIAETRTWTAAALTSVPPKLQPLGIDGDRICICKRGRRRRQPRRARLEGWLNGSDSGHKAGPNQSGSHKHSDIQHTHRKSERRRRDKPNAKNQICGRNSKRRQKKQESANAAVTLLGSVAEGAADLAQKTPCGRWWARTASTWVKWGVVALFTSMVVVVIVAAVLIT